MYREADSELTATQNELRRVHSECNRIAELVRQDERAKAKTLLSGLLVALRNQRDGTSDALERAGGDPEDGIEGRPDSSALWRHRLAGMLAAWEAAVLVAEDYGPHLLSPDATEPAPAPEAERQ